MTKASLAFRILASAALLFSTGVWARSNVHRYDPASEDVPAAPWSDGLFASPDSADTRLSGDSHPFLSPFLDRIMPAAIAGQWYDQLLDPMSPSDTRTFKQRYYIDSEHADGPLSPVVYYICGESECLPRSFQGRFAEDVATALHAHIVALEHRYYGKSVPFDQLTADNLRYLSTENALADLARFQKHAMTDLGLAGKWIAIGGSYPGSLSAFYRLKHPELVEGALASSAPVQAKNAFVEYDKHVNQVLGKACGDALRKVVAASEAAWPPARPSSPSSRSSSAAPRSSRTATFSTCWPTSRPTPSSTAIRAIFAPRSPRPTTRCPFTPST
jgi:hypothetical protein